MILFALFDRETYDIFIIVSPALFAKQTRCRKMISFAGRILFSSLRECNLSSHTPLLTPHRFRNLLSLLWVIDAKAEPALHYGTQARCLV